MLGTHIQCRAAQNITIFKFKAPTGRNLAATMADRHPTSLTHIPIVLLGCGGVGQHLISHILDTRILHAAQGVHISVKAICDSKSVVMSGDGHVPELEDAVLKRIILAKASGSPLCSLETHGSADEWSIDDLKEHFKGGNISRCLEKWSSSGLVVVDCTATDDTALLLSRAADMGLCIVLANKKPLTSILELYDKLSRNRRRLRYESTVGAGLPVITALTRFLTAGDPVYRIVGALSGTLGYVMSGLQEGQAFSSVVQLAKSLGYTEPDPRDDLGGMDVARKALIMACLIGWQINIADIKVESLFPEEMGPEKMSKEQFLMEGLLALDREISERIQSAQARGFVLRYVATIENGSCEVGIRELPHDSPLGQLKGSDNLVEIYSRCYKVSPFVIQGAGAGNDTTAAGVLADILELQDLFCS